MPLLPLLDRARVVVVLGAGGVGKTTISAALGLSAAERGRRTVVVTADPARRLAGALGLEGLPDVPHAVPGAAGPLAAMMIDQRRSWDRLMRRHATAAALERMLDNPFYALLARGLAGTHELLAIEELCQQASEFELTVLDTPPAAQALEFLDAPRRLRAFLRPRTMRLLLAAYRSRGVQSLASSFVRAVEDATGARALGDLAEFLALLGSLVDGLVARTRELEALLRDRGTALVLVCEPSAPGVEAARGLGRELADRGLPPRAVIVNRFHRPAPEVAGAGAVEAALAAAGIAAPARAWIAGNHLAYARMAAAEAARLDALEAEHPRAALTAVPTLEADVHDLGGLRALGAALGVTPAAAPRAS